MILHGCYLKNSARVGRGDKGPADQNEGPIIDLKHAEVHLPQMRSCGDIHFTFLKKKIVDKLFSFFEGLNT